MSRPKRQQNERIPKNIFIIFTIFLSLRLLASFFPDSRLWGLNQAAFIDGFFLFYIIIFILGYLLYSGKIKIRWLRGNESQASISLKPSSNIYVYVLFVVWAFSFYLFSVKAHFLGDGLAAIAKLSNPNVGPLIREYGEELLHILFVKSFGGFTREFSYFTYQTISIISGIIFLAALMYYAAKITNSWGQYYVFILLNLFSVIILLFFGYIENYSITASMIYVMILSSLAALHNEKKSIIPVVSFCAAVFLHTLSLVYLPAIFIYAGLTFFGMSARKFLIKYYRVMIGALLLLFLLFYSAIKLWGPMFWRLAFLSPFGDRFTIDNYFLLSFNHLLDYANLLLFIMPITLIILFLKIRSSKNELLAIKEGITAYLAIMIVFGLTAAFFIEPKIGMARDWDIMAAILIGASLAGSYLWISLFRQIKRFRVASSILILIQISIFIPWLSINNSLGNSYEYVTTVMELDPQHNRSGLITLKGISKGAGNYRELARLTRRVRIYFPEIELDKKAIRFYARGEYSRAARLFQQAIDANPGYYGSYQGLANCYKKLGRNKPALENLKIADGLNPQNALVNNDMGDIYYSMGEMSSAMHYWKRCLAYDRLYPGTYLSLAKYYLSLNIYDSTIHYLAVLPDTVYSPESFYIRGTAHLALADTNSALENYHNYQKAGSDSLILNKIESIENNITTH